MENEMKNAGEKLWQLLDDIDTLSDQIKPTDLEGYKAFYEATMKRCQKRNEIAFSEDGHTLVWVHEKEIKLPGQENIKCIRERVEFCLKNAKPISMVMQFGVKAMGIPVRLTDDDFVNLVAEKELKEGISENSNIEWFNLKYVIILVEGKAMADTPQINQIMQPGIMMTPRRG